MAQSGTMKTGTVKAWIEDRGMGFLSADDGGDDAFVHRCELVDGVCLLVGSPVVFEDNWDYSKNKRVAKKVTGAAPADAKSAGKGSPGATLPAVEVQRGTMITGVVKAWKDERGMGFIAPATGGDDAFVHRSSLVDGQWLVVGAPVMFEDGWDQMKGKRIAKNVTGAVSIEGKGAGVDPNAGYVGKGQALPPIDTTGMLSGTVKAWYEDRGMGFIRPDTGGEDVFVHRSDLTDGQWLVVGAHVNFEEGWDPNKNKTIARNVTGAAHVAAEGGVANDGMRTGIVKMWLVEKAFGFVIPDGGGDDVMVHKNEVADGVELAQGMPVKFDAVWDPAKGKYKATRCFPAFSPPANGAYGAPHGSKVGPFAPSDNLFIAGLPMGYNEDLVRQIFGQYGAVTNVRVLPNTGKPDVACMVRMADATMAMWMVENLNGNIPVGLNTPITVKYAQPYEKGGYGKALGKGPVQSRWSPYSPAPPPQPAQAALPPPMPPAMPQVPAAPATMPPATMAGAVQYQHCGGLEAPPPAAVWAPSMTAMPEYPGTMPLEQVLAPQQAQSAPLGLEVMPGGLPGVMPVGAPAVMPVGAPAVMPGSSPAVMPGGVPTVMPVGPSAVMPTGAPGVMPAGAPPVMPAGAPGAMPAGAPAVMPASMPAVMPAGVPAVMPGGVPPAMPVPAVCPDSFDSLGYATSPEAIALNGYGAVPPVPPVHNMSTGGYGAPEWNMDMATSAGSLGQPGPAPPAYGLDLSMAAWEASMTGPAVAPPPPPPQLMGV